MQLPFKLLGAAVALAISTVANPASAQDNSARQTTFVVGAGIGGTAEYAGGDRFRAVPIIFADYQNANGFFASVTRGLGFATKLDRLDLSAALAYDGGRYDEKRTFGSGSDDLKGMGKIKGAAIAKLRADYDFGIVKLALEANLALSDRDRGNSVQLAASVPLLRAATNQVKGVLSTQYRDDDGMQTWYGVTPVQSRQSGYRIFQPDGGFDIVSLSLNWNHILDKSWSINTTAGVSRLLGDAGDSPLTRRRNSPLLIGVVNYRF